MSWKLVRNGGVLSGYVGYRVRVIVDSHGYHTTRFDADFPTSEEAAAFCGRLEDSLTRDEELRDILHPGDAYQGYEATEHRIEGDYRLKLRWS